MTNTYYRFTLVSVGNIAGLLGSISCVFLLTSATYAAEPSLIITEIMANPKAVADSDGEWFEVYNPSDQVVDLTGYALKDEGKDKHVIGPLPVQPKSYIVLCRNSNLSENGGVTCSYQYDHFSLSNEEDEIIFEKEGALVVTFKYTKEFSLSSGKSMELASLDSDLNNKDHWQVSSVQYGNGDYGSPGKENSPVEPTSIPTSHSEPTVKPTDMPKPSKTPTPYPTKTPEPTTTPTIKKLSITETSEKIRGDSAVVSPVEEPSVTPAIESRQGSMSGFFLGGGIVSFLGMVGSFFYMRFKNQ